eukprot:7953360-Pyramimonas_sp.AAC.1
MAWRGPEEGPGRDDGAEVQGAGGGRRRQERRRTARSHGCAFVGVFASAIATPSYMAVFNTWDV